MSSQIMHTPSPTANQENLNRRNLLSPYDTASWQGMKLTVIPKSLLSFPPRMPLRGKPWPREGGAPAGIQKKQKTIFVSFCYWIPDQVGDDK